MTKSSKGNGFDYCYVRFRGGPIRDLTIKLFYQENTLFTELVARAKTFGDRIKSIQFPDNPVPINQEELEQARNENRVIP
jgi:hypothetical protein